MPVCRDSCDAQLPEIQFIFQVIAYLLAYPLVLPFLDSNFDSKRKPQIRCWIWNSDFRMPSQWLAVTFDTLLMDRESWSRRISCGHELWLMMKTFYHWNGSSWKCFIKTTRLSLFEPPADRWYKPACPGGRTVMRFYSNRTRLKGIHFFQLKVCTVSAFCLFALSLHKVCTDRQNLAGCCIWQLREFYSIRSINFRQNQLKSFQ